MSPREMLLAKRDKFSLKGALSTGSTLLNLACTGYASFGFLKGGYYYLVGDSQSGKTFLTLTCFAEACQSEAFKNYRLIFDDVEGGAMMDIEHYFGKEVAKRMEPPATTSKGQPIFSDTVESFYYHIFDLLEEGEPFIYVLDSQDALGSSAAARKFGKQRKAAIEGKEEAGSYGDGKAKYHSEHIREVIAGLRKTKSILIIIGQTRDNLGFGFEKKTRSGGKALRFYANIEIWTSVLKMLKKAVRGQDRTVGARCLAQVKKNRVTGRIGKDWAVEIPIYNDLGIDDMGSCVDFLIANGHWDKIASKPSRYRATGLNIKGSRSGIISFIETKGLENKVREMAEEVWQKIEEECLPNRKKRYE